MESDFIQQIGDKINLDWIMDRKINFEAGIGCRLKCGGCYMRFNMSPKATGTPLKKYYSQAWDRRYNIPFEKYKIIFDAFYDFEFCGNLSDPIYHPDFIKTLKHLKGREIKIKFRTNGSGKSTEWWEEVFELCKGETWGWTFGLDGLPEDSHKYRINQDGNQVWEMMKLGRSKGIRIEWQWIVFNYNQNDIREGQLMAAQYGIIMDEYHSSRWGDEMAKFKPTEEYATASRRVLADKKTIKEQGIEIEIPDWIQGVDDKNREEVFWDNYNDIGNQNINKAKFYEDDYEIEPDCLRLELTKDIMFNSLGYFIPCCEQDQWVEDLTNRGFYNEDFHIDNLHTVEDIKNVFRSDTWQDFYWGLRHDPIHASPKCRSFCRKNRAEKDPKGFV